MHKSLIALAALAVATPALPQASAAIASGKAQPSPLAPSEIVARAPKAEWMAIEACVVLPSLNIWKTRSVVKAVTVRRSITTNASVVAMESIVNPACV